MSSPYFINVETPIENTDGTNKIRNKYNYTISKDLYLQKDDNIPNIYNYIYKLYSKINKKPIITTSFDSSISASTITGLSERYMNVSSENGKPKFTSNLKIIYIDSSPDLKDIYDNTMIDYCNSIVSNVLCLNDYTYTKHNIVIDPSQIIYLGLNDDCLTDEDIFTLSEHKFEYFTLKKMRNKKINNILSHIIDCINDDPVLIVFDLSVCCADIAPCVVRSSDKDGKNVFSGINLDELIAITSQLSTLNIVGLDITGYDLRIDDTKIPFRVTCETVNIIIKNLFNIKEKKINIFNENTRFLIWRSINDNDLGWNILRNVPLELRIKLLEKLDEDDIITFTIPRDSNDEEDYEDVYISSTTMAEQETKSYALLDEDQDYTSCILYPEEKISMLFELLNFENK